MRTVTIGMRGKESGPVLPYVPKQLQEQKLGIQRIAVICPVEDQQEENTVDSDSESAQAPELSIADSDPLVVASPENLERCQEK